MLSRNGGCWLVVTTKLKSSIRHFLTHTSPKYQFQSSSSSIAHDPNPHFDITSLNKMIIRFSRTGDLLSARNLFDQMPQRDIVSWNSILTAYSQSESSSSCCDEALRIFKDMHARGCNPNYTSLSIILSSSAKLRALDQGKQIHGLSIKTRSSSNVYVGTSLITMYSKCNVFDCLVRLFHEIDCPNPASWNALILGFLLNHRIYDARQIFDHMPLRNVVSWTSMISAYIEVKKVRVALELFNSMPVKSSVSRSVMLGGFVSNGQYEEAIKFFARMTSDGVQPTAAIVTKVIKACSSMKHLKLGRTMHAYVVKLGFRHDQIIEATLISMYCECLNMDDAVLEFKKMECTFMGSWNCLLYGYISNGQINEARSLFDKMAVRDNISWNSMISGYLKVDKIDDAIELFSVMPECTMETTTALMSYFINNGRLDEAQKLFDAMPQIDVMSSTTLIFGYVEEGLLDKAMELFNKMSDRNVVTYNVIISGLLRHGKTMEAYNLFNKSPVRDARSWDALVTGFVQNGLYNEAFLLYKKMVSCETISPSESIIVSLLKASSTRSLLIHGEQIHLVAIKLGHESCLVVGNSLVNMYCKCGSMLIAESLFGRMGVSDVVTWNSMIYGYGFNGQGEKALEMFENMKSADIKPDEITFLGVLSSCSHMQLVEQAQHYFNSMIFEYGVIPKVTHYACMIDLLSRMGMVETAEELAGSMPFEPDPVIWTSLLSGCRLNCDAKSAEHAAKHLFAWDPMDSMPCLHLVSIYKSLGRWDDVEKLQKYLTQLGLTKQPGRSWI